MALMKYDMADNETFIKPTRGVYPEYVISVEEFKDRNARIMKNRWIDTSHGAKGEKIYELFNPDMDGEIVKESLQEWLCNHRHKITQSIGIALCNHEMSYAEWFRYINNQSGPDKLALYSLSHKHGIHTSVFNKSYIWTTLMNHVNRTDDEIISLSGINLVYLGATTYGIIRDIRTPHPQPNPTPPKMPGHTSKCASKVTCRSGSRGRKTSGKDSTGCGRGNCGKASQTLSESRQENYGITATNVTPCSVQSSRQPIDYVSLNDGYEDETPSLSKKRCKESHRPRSAPSATRLSAHKRMNSPESTALDGDNTTTDTFTAVPTPSTSTLEGIPNADEQLPDLVLPQPGSVQENKLSVNVGNTEEDLAAITLLSLGDTLEDTLDEGDENALLMPIGGANVPEDVAPQPLQLDQVSVDNAIAGLVETEQLEKDSADNKKEESILTDTLPIKQDQTDANSSKKGTLETKTYVLKKKTEKSKHLNAVNVSS